MNITLQNVDPVNAIIKIDIVKEDYISDVEKSLKNLRQNATFPGFRKGMVPLGMVKKMYEKSTVAEQINKIVVNNLYGYIRENKINVLGEPLPNTTEQPEINFDTQEDFQFCFDIGIAPEIKIDLSKEDILPYYTIKVEDEQVEQQVNSFRANYGSYEEAEQTEEKDLVKGLVTELNEDGSPKENGIQVEDAVLMPSYIKKEEEKNKFIGITKNTVITFNPFDAYEGNEAELSSFLKVKKEEINNHTGSFSFEVRDITRYKEAEINQDLFDKVFGPDTVKTEEEFKQKVKDMIAVQYTPNSDYKFLLDARNMLEEKAGEVIFPDEFLKRWLLSSNSDRTPESVEDDFPKILDDLKFHLIKEQIAKENEFNVENEELTEYAKRSVRAQFAQYGMANVPADLIENYAADMLKKEDTVRNLIDKIMEDKTVNWLKDQLTLELKEVTVEEFKDLLD
jgi:trigger factor